MNDEEDDWVFLNVKMVDNAELQLEDALIRYHKRADKRVLPLLEYLTEVNFEIYKMVIKCIIPPFTTLFSSNKISPKQPVVGGMSENKIKKSDTKNKQPKDDEENITK